MGIVSESTCRMYENVAATCRSCTVRGGNHPRSSL